MSEEILECLCNALVKNYPDRFAWVKGQGKEDYAGGLFDMDNWKVYLVEVVAAKLEPMGADE